MQLNLVELCQSPMESYFRYNMFNQKPPYERIDMRLDDSIAGVISARLNNPISRTLREIGFGKLLQQSNISRKPKEQNQTHSKSSNTPHPKKGPKDSPAPYQVILHLLVMLLANKRLSTFLKGSKESFGKDVYYRLLKESRYNWRKLLLLSAVRLIQKLQPLGSPLDTRVLIIDDTVEEKRGKKIEGSCDRLFSNGKKKYVRGLNILSLNYSDPYSSFILDFAIALNNHLRIPPEAFTQKVHHATHACKRRMEGLESKLDLAFEMVKRALKEGVVADYLLCDSWYAKPVFLKKIKEMGLDVVARLPLNDSIWHFKGKQKTLKRCYENITRPKKHGHHGKVRYTYCSAVLHHGVLERVKVLFIETINTKERKLIPILSTDTTLSDEAMIDLYKKRWNIEQGYKDLREYFGLGKEEVRLYEALIARMTLSMFSYNLLNYINRIEHEPKTLGELFRELECELQALAISMELFLQILSDLAGIAEIGKNGDLERIIAIMRAHVQKEMGIGYENRSSCQAS